MKPWAQMRCFPCRYSSAVYIYIPSASLTGLAIPLGVIPATLTLWMFSSVEIVHRRKARETDLKPTVVYEETVQLTSWFPS